MSVQACSFQNNNNGWCAQLDLHFEHSGVRTVLQKNRHYGPLRVQRPFYPEGELAHVYILHPPGGVVGGDQLNIALQVQNKAQVLCTMPGAGKFYLSTGDWALLHQTLRVTAGSSLEWLPQENILFSGARLRSRTKVKLEDDAIFIGTDISCLGRPANNETFNNGVFDSRFMFYHNKKLLLTENLRVTDKQDLVAATGLRGHAVQASLFAFPCNEEHLDLVRKQCQSSLEPGLEPGLMGTTLFDSLLVMRILGADSWALKQQLVSTWKTLRPALLNRTATLPRIWAT